MRILRNHDNINEYFSLDKNELIKSNNTLLYIGLYKMINDEICMIYVESENLYIKWRKFLFLIDDSFRAKIKTVKQIDSNTGIKKFQLYQYRFFTQNKLLFEYEYSMSFGYSITNPFDSIEESDEDWDWGLYLCNIINNKDRRLGFISARSK